MDIEKTKPTGLQASDCLFPEYPRPQLEREQWLCLNGLYDYAICDKSQDIPEQYDGKILVPYSLETELSGVEKSLRPGQRLWYRRFFELDNRFDNKRTILNFGAVDWLCKVFINGQLVGGHSGGYGPFSIDISAYIKQGENELIVRVYDPSQCGSQPRGKQDLKPHGFWYTPTSGIWQTVWLEAVSSTYIESIKLLPDIDKACININTKINNNSPVLIVATVEGQGLQKQVRIINKEDSIDLPQLRLWSPEDPFLYDLTLELLDACGLPLDKIKSYFGMRKFSIGQDESGLPRLFLNNKAYFHNGLLDQGYWPESGLTAPNEEALIYDIEKTKGLGFNMLRKHIKVEPLRWYYHCDRLGMLVWQDMPSGGAYIGNLMAGALPIAGINVKDNKYKLFKRQDEKMREDFEKELYEMIDTLYNCVSIACWVPFNEGWGQFDAKRIGENVKAYDNSRHVDHASGWHDQKGPDFKSMHRYILPVTLPKNDGRPFVLSEFGGYSMIEHGHTWNEKKAFGYRMFKDKESLSRAYKKLFEKQIIPLIEKGLSATVYTQVSDVENEVNGIFTYDRALLKLDENTLKDLNKRMTL